LRSYSFVVVLHSYPFQLANVGGSGFFFEWREFGAASSFLPSFVNRFV
jgi:hypothetical protein